MPKKIFPLAGSVTCVPPASPPSPAVIPETADDDFGSVDNHAAAELGSAPDRDWLLGCRGFHATELRSESPWNKIWFPPLTFAYRGPGLHKMQSIYLRVLAGRCRAAARSCCRTAGRSCSGGDAPSPAYVSEFIATADGLKLSKRSCRSTTQKCDILSSDSSSSSRSWQREDHQEGPSGTEIGWPYHRHRFG